MKNSPNYAEEIKDAAIVFRFCGRELEPKRRVAEAVSVATGEVKLAEPIVES